MTAPTTSTPPLRLENRHTGEALEIRRHRRGGDSWLELRGTLPPRRDGSPLHVHHAEDEAGEIVAGTLSATVGGQRLDVAAGGTVQLPKGIPHRWWNEPDQPLAFNGKARPAVDLDRYLQAVF